MKQLMAMAASVFLFGPMVQAGTLDAGTLAKQELGKALFFDPVLSATGKQSCASCHAPESGFADPGKLPISAGAIKGRYTRRNAPSIAYAKFVPARYFDKQEAHYIGGLFHDGRAQNLEKQMLGPMYSAAEMANSEKSTVIKRLRNSHYLAKFSSIYGKDALSGTDVGLEQLTEVIAAYERSEEVNPFNSKYDYYLAGKVALSEQEQRGLEVYRDEKKGNCAACHPHEASDGKPALFTDFTYDNLGVPTNKQFASLFGEKNLVKNRLLPDRGLGEITHNPEQDGLFRVPTLRNIAKTAPYMHNGLFNELREVLVFYNERDVSHKWSKPEVAQNVNKEELGDLKLSEQEIDDLLAFLHTLSDGYALAAN